MKNIYPTTTSANYTVSFVPLYRNILEQKKNKHQKVTIMEGTTISKTFYSRDFIPGRYVTRIKIIPTVGERLHYWINDYKPIFPRKTKDNKNEATPVRSIRKLIKKKI